MSTTAPTLATERRTPPWGGFSGTLMGLELRRALRNRRTVIFTVVVPPVLFLLFGTDGSYKTQSAGNGNVTAYIMISMAVYGAMIASTSGGAMVSIERAVGWSRQLRLTPLHPLAYVTVKVACAMVMGLVAVVAVFVVGLAFGADLPVSTLVACGVLGWVCSALFAAFGLFMGYLLPSENVMQVLGPLLAVLSFAGGLFVPLSQMSQVFADIATYTPVYGVGVIARYPLSQEGTLWTAVLNVVVWTAVFVGGAVWRFRRDTARV
ncbi:ABC transporter permease [Solicola sp. PLA-1-18]|uniref:ABC transporter permease n=1 Tax=Solicola sp. PLA-1-18 TaxID=3380532 RepID=UPI003B825544